MKILIYHQNFPGQFKSLAPVLANLGHEVVGIGDAKNIGHRKDWPTSMRVIPYSQPQGHGKDTHHYLKSTEAGVRRGQQVFRHLVSLKNDGFYPDICIGHTGWGDSLYIKNVYPNAKNIGFFEFFYRNKGQDIGFDPEFPPSPDDYLRIPTKNSLNWLALDGVDWCISPTKWQASTYPFPFRRQMSVIFDGIDTDRIAPTKLDDEYRFGEFNFKPGHQPIITFVNRNLEPYRGYHIFLRAISEIQKKNPEAKFLLVGGDKVSYGMPPPGKSGWKDFLWEKERKKIKTNNVYFLGQLSYSDYLKLLNLSTVHVYLTYPFVQSWSMVEAMSAGCAVVASRTSPVTEFITDGVNGSLFNFLDHNELANKVVQLIDSDKERKRFGENAREHIINNYDLKRVILPKQVQLIEGVLSRKNLPGAIYE